MRQGAPARIGLAAASVAAVVSLAGASFATASTGQEQRSEATKRVALTAGRSTVITTDFDVVRIAVTTPAVADAVVVQPREVLIDGKSAGTVSLILWGAGLREQY